MPPMPQDVPRSAQRKKIGAVERNTMPYKPHNSPLTAQRLRTPIAAIILIAMYLPMFRIGMVIGCSLDGEFVRHSVFPFVRNSANNTDESAW